MVRPTLFVAAMLVCLAASSRAQTGPLRYQIDAALDAKAKAIRGHVSVTLTNVATRPLRALRFHLYLNAFSSADTLFMRSSGGALRGDRYDPDERGSIRIVDARAANKALRFRKIEDGTVLAVDLTSALAPGATLTVRLGFRARLPRVFARTGHADDFFMIAQWFPKLGFLRADGTWHCPPFHGNAEFFAPFASYDVTLDAARELEIAGPATLASRRPAAAGRTRWRWTADRVHDVAFAAWPHFDRTTVTHGRTKLHFFTVPGRGGQSARQRRFVRTGLTRLSAWLGPYPYPSLSIVDVPTRALGASAMEYPTLFTAWTPWWMPRGVHITDEITAHELTHQYFQGIVATNEAEEPWLDEGLTTYVSGLLLDDELGVDRSTIDLVGIRVGQLQKLLWQHRGARGTPHAIGGAARSFPSWGAYGRAVYARTALMMRTIASLIGRRRMLRALGRYARKHAFAHPTGADLRRELVSATPARRRATVRELLAGVVDRGDAFDVSVRCEARRVIVERRGKLTVPIDVEITTVDGAVRRIEWDGETHRRDYATAKPVRVARIGPPARLGLDVTPLDHVCLPPRTVHAAAVDWGRLAQILLQLVGP